MGEKSNSARVFAAELEPFYLGKGLSNVVVSSGGRFPLEAKMHGIIYLVGLVVVILAILSFFGLR
jgi:hypothetical protein